MMMQLTSSFVAPPATRTICFGDVVKAQRKWLHMPDDVPVRVILATILTSRVQGDPLWTFPVGPPGDLKTELLRAVELDPWAYMITNLTAQSLVSGLSKDDEFDLLPKLDGRTLLIRDFTTILSKKYEDQAQLFGKLRTYYDGAYSDSYGSIGTKKGESHFNMLAAVTSEIDRAVSAQSKLGDRYLKIRVHGDEREAVNRAMENSGKEDAMRDEIKGAVQKFLSSVTTDPMSVDIPDRELIKSMARFLAKARTTVERDRNHDVDEMPQPEMPTRIVKQLTKLARGFAVVESRGVVVAADLAMVGCVVMDTLPPSRAAILKAFPSPQSRVPFRVLRDATKLPGASLDRHIDDLELLGILDRGSDGCKLSDEIRAILEPVWSSLFPQTPQPIPYSSP